MWVGRRNSATRFSSDLMGGIGPARKSYRCTESGPLRAVHMLDSRVSGIFAVKTWPAGAHSISRAMQMCYWRSQIRRLRPAPESEEVRMRRARRVSDFEWTFSTRVRERACSQCRSRTTGFLTNLSTGLRKPLCSTCFFAAAKEAGSSALPRKQPGSASSPIQEMEQLRLC